MVLPALERHLATIAAQAEAARWHERKTRPLKMAEWKARGAEGMTGGKLWPLMHGSDEVRRFIEFAASQRA